MPPRKTSTTARAAAAAATPMTATAIEQLIEARVSAALANHETLQNSTNGQGDGSHNSDTGIRGTVLTPHVAYAMDWKALKKMMIVKYCPKGEIKKLEIELWNLKESEEVEKYVGGLPDMIQGNKRKLKFNAGNNLGHQQQYKRQNTRRAYTAGPGEKIEYTGSFPLSSGPNGALQERLTEAKEWKPCRASSCPNTKTQKYILKGHHVFLAHVTTKETEDKSGEKRLEEVPIIRYFSEVFPKDLLGLPSTRQVKFQINLMLGTAPVARAPYRLAPSEMKELSE
ncbi:hypothetical protein Tco_0958580 [Tanacetum coccineum]